MAEDTDGSICSYRILKAQIILHYQNRINKKQTSKANMTESSKDILITCKNKRLKLLEEENQLLKEQLMNLRGKICDSF